MSMGDHAFRFDEDGLLEVVRELVLLAVSGFLDFAYVITGCFRKSVLDMDLRRRLFGFGESLLLEISMGDHA